MRVPRNAVRAREMWRVTSHFLLDGDDLLAAASAFSAHDGRMEELQEVEVVTRGESVEQGFCSQTFVSRALLSVSLGKTHG